MIKCEILCLCGFAGTPRPAVTLDTAEEDEEASEPHKTGIKLSNLEFSVFGDYAVVPSIEVCNTFNIHHISLYGAEIAASSIKDKATTASVTRRVGVISRSKWTHLFSQSRAIPSQSVLWSE